MRGARQRTPLCLAGVFLAVALAQVRAETLQDAWLAALAGNARVRAAQARADSALAEFDSAEAARWPVVTAAASVSRFADPPALDLSSAGLPALVPLFAGDSVTVASAQVTIPVYTGGMLRANVSAAAAGFAAQERSSNAVAAGVKLAVAEAYVAVLRAESSLAAAETAVASLAAHERDAADMEASGQVPRNDRLAAAVSLGLAEQSKLEAENALELARAAYNRTLARSLAAPVDIAPEVSIRSAELDAPLAELVASALEKRPDLHALAALETSYGERATAKRAERRPQLALSGGYSYLENGVLNREDYGWVGLGVRWTLFDSGHARSAAAALEQTAKAAARDFDDLRASVELEVRGAWLALAAARARRGVAERALAQAEENLRVVSDRYRNGEGTSSEALDAEALRSASRANVDAARFDAVLAEARLAYAAGLL